jgi:hypothetical protein
MATKILWIYWQQGWEHAPDLVKQCAESWRVNNPDYEIHWWDQSSVTDYISLPKKISRPRKNLTIQKISDLTRLDLLSKFGGVGTDASVFCVRPLSQWLGEHYGSFFCIPKSGKDPVREGQGSAGNGPIPLPAPGRGEEDTDLQVGAVVQCLEKQYAVRHDFIVEDYCAGNKAGNSGTKDKSSLLSRLRGMENPPEFATYVLGGCTPQYSPACRAVVHLPIACSASRRRVSASGGASAGIRCRAVCASTIE